MSNNMVGSVLVIGAGISGMQSSLDLAEVGYKVYLVEKSPGIGGRMPMLDKTFPTNDCAMCTLSPKLVECGRHRNIEIITCSEVSELSGEPGNYSVQVKKHPRFVDSTKCVGCGSCSEVCPVSVPNEFNQHMGLRKSIYKLYPQAYPNTYMIERAGASPCSYTCPAGIKPHGYVALTREGKYEEAFKLMLETTPVLGSLGRACFAPCEDECTRCSVDSSLPIRKIKRFLADNYYKDHPVSEEIIPEYNGKKVAIIGSGPAGLTAALHLVRLGYQVKIFEAEAKAGGMLRFAIPAYRLPKDVVDQDIKNITDLGVDIETNVRVQDLEELKNQNYDAVFLAIGTQGSMPMSIPGEDSSGVVDALDFLRQVNLNNNQAPAGVEVHGKTVVVIGGGNVAIDSARVALRLGAQKVIIQYRRSREEMPAHHWEIQAAESEGVEIQYLSAPKAFIASSGGLSQVEYIQMELGQPDESGRRKPQEVKGSEQRIDAQLAIVAIGMQPDTQNWANTLKLTSNKTIEVDPNTLQTSLPYVFAGGDVVTGPSMIVEAVGQGKRAAFFIDRYLNGVELNAAEYDLHLPMADKQEVIRRSLSTGRLLTLSSEDSLLAVSGQFNGFEEIEPALTIEEASSSSTRCLDCGICSECRQCINACQSKAINHSMQEETVQLNVGAIIMCAGYELFNAELRGEYGFGEYENVYTSLQFERMLSASGPYEGHVQKADGTTPQKIAFIQCVGSRDVSLCNGYCSAVCCMYATKEAMIAQDHVPGLDTTIFNMDIRAFGKDYEKYYNRAKDQYNVHYIQSMISSVKEVPGSKNLKVRYRTPEGMVEEEYEMLVLSVGLKPSREAVDLAGVLGIRLNNYNFCQLEELSGVKTSKEGIYVAGVFSGPKDIPETVMQASAAAGDTAAFLAEVRNTEVTPRVFPEEKDVSAEEPRIGVFVCHCGTNIANVVDVKAVVEHVQTLPNVVYANDNLYVCAQDSQLAMKELIEEHNLNRVVVASCTIRTHKPLFQETMKETGLNPALFEMANIRDQCSWVHSQEPEKATQKAKDLASGAVAKVATLQPTKRITVNVNNTALVVGGGVAGMTSALSLSDQGYKVHLLEKTDQLGGMALQIREGFNGENISAFIKQLSDSVKNSPRINLCMSSDIEEVSGYVGNFKTRLNTGDVLEHGVTIIASGAQESKPDEYLYGQDSRVMTQLELDTAIAAEDPKLKSAENIVMIQCVGSREEHRPYCSRICCTKTMKLALKLKEINPAASIIVLYRDIRTYSFNEDFYREARSKGVLFFRYDLENKPQVNLVDGKLRVTAKDHIMGETYDIDVDLLTLASPIEPSESNNKLSQLFKVPLNSDSFFQEAHMKLRPVDFSAEGIYMCGLAHGPKSLEESISQAKAAAGRATSILSRDELESEGAIAIVDQTLCAACLTCVRLCPFKAPHINKHKAEIEAVVCQGCGSCAAECPNKAITLQSYSFNQLTTQVEGIMNHRHFES